MEKFKNRKIIIVGVFLLLLLSFSIYMSFNNGDISAKKDIIKKDEFDPDAWKRYAEKIYFEEREDGWYNYFWMDTIDKDRRDLTYSFGGCNIKYPKLDGYNVLVFEGGEIVGRIPTNPTLAVSEKTINGVMQWEEINKIRDFFNDKQFNRVITPKDLNSLKLYHFSKDELVRMYNNAFEKPFKTEVPLETNLTTCNIKTDGVKNGYNIVVGVLHVRTGFQVVRLDIKYSNGTYLRDLVSRKKATKEQMKIYNNFKEIEKYMVDYNKVDLKEHFGFQGEVYERVYKIVNKFLEL